MPDKSPVENPAIDDEEVIDLLEVVTLGKSAPQSGEDSDTVDFSQHIDSMMEELAKHEGADTEDQPFPDPTPVDHVVDPNEELPMPSMQDLDNLLESLGAAPEEELSSAKKAVSQGDDLDLKVPTEPAPAQVEAPVEVSPAPAQAETPVEASPAPAQAEAPVEASPAPAQVEAPVEVSPAPAQAETPVEASPAPAQAEAPVEASPAPAQAETPVEASPAPAQAEAPVEASPAPAQAETPVEVNPAPTQAETPVEVNPAQVEAPVEASPAPAQVEIPLDTQDLDLKASSAPAEASPAPAQVEIPLDTQDLDLKVPSPPAEASPTQAETPVEASPTQAETPVPPAEEQEANVEDVDLGDLDALIDDVLAIAPPSGGNAKKEAPLENTSPSAESSSNGEVLTGDIPNTLEGLHSTVTQLQAIVNTQARHIQSLQVMLDENLDKKVAAAAAKVIREEILALLQPNE